MLNLIFFGPPGVGKGTQAARVAKYYDLVHVSTGDILREEIKLETELGLKVKDIIASGELVPDEFLIEVLENTCSKHPGAKGFVFDGFPRTLRQAEALDELMKRQDCKIAKVISLEVPEDELLRRLVNRAIEQGRTDDTAEVIKNRLIVYQKHTKPLIDYYKRKNIFIEVPGVGTIGSIFASLCKVIENH
ncbi:MAG: adenylate kinase [Bacteroidales bacterium]|nr:adenylate kinase [Bacteroidales bacterium]